MKNIPNILFIVLCALIVILLLISSFWGHQNRNSEDHKVFVNVCGTTIVGKTSNFSTPVMKVLSLEDIDKKNDGAFVYDAL